MPPELTFTVQSPKGDSDEFTFEQNTKIGAAAKEVADAFNYPNANNPTFFRTEDGEREELQRNRTLVSYQLDGTTVILSDSGKGASE